MASLEARKKGDINKPDKILAKQPDPSVLFPFSSHVAFTTESGYIKCARCSQSYHRKHEYVRKWLVIGCPMLHSDGDRPRPLPLELLHIGNRSIHHSHKINTFKGLIYCRICGARAGSTAAGFLKLLAKPCTFPGSYGKDNIKRLSEGRLPRGLKCWPIDTETDLPTAKRRRAKPMSDFAAQILHDHPGLSTSEAKVIADTLLRRAGNAAQQQRSAGSSAPSA